MMIGSTRRAAIAAIALMPMAGMASRRSWAAGTATATPVMESAVRAVYDARGSAPLWAGSPEAEAHRVAMLALLNREHRLDPGIAPDTFSLAQRLASTDPTTVAQGELELTRVALAYLARRRGGLPVETSSAMRSLQLLDRVVADSELDVALLELRVVASLGGWRGVGSKTIAPVVEPSETILPEGEVAPTPRPRTVVDQQQLRLRLVQSMDLSARYLAGAIQPAALTQAVRTFQRRNDLPEDGNPAGRTLAALNAPIEPLVERVRLNVERKALLAPRDGHARYVEVNIPSYELKLVEGGRVALEMRVVVGDQETETPIFDDLMRYVDVNPSWYVPPSIVKEMTAKFASDPGFFDRNGYAWRGNGGLMQKPGPENALGRFKFLFPNRHAVYLHDTAQRRYFSRADRSLSHGCIRVEKPMELAAAILGRQGWNTARLQQTVDTKRTRRVELDEPMPVFLDYQTAVVQPDGRLRMLPDLYGHDAKRRIAFTEKQSPYGGPLTPQPEVVPADPDLVAPTVQPELPPQQAATVPAPTTKVTAVQGPGMVD